MSNKLHNIARHMKPGVVTPGHTDGNSNIDDFGDKIVGVETGILRPPNMEKVRDLAIAISKLLDEKAMPMKATRREITMALKSVHMIVKLNNAIPEN